MTLRACLHSSILAATLCCGPALAETAPGLIVHEWGTFLAMNGSNGVSLDGMYHEEHALPSFVHARSRDQLRISTVLLKGETPVIYFYTKQPLSVQVSVGFPRGTWTQWYPQARLVTPPLAHGGSPTEPKNGRILWFADIVPPGDGTLAASLPKTAPGALWNFARDVDAAFVKTIDSTRASKVAETERFLFYRGLGRATLPLKLDAQSGGTLSLDREGPKGVRHVFTVRVEGGRGVYSYRPGITPGETVSRAIPEFAGARPLAEFVPALADDVAAKLVESGLYPKEARAMVNTWSTSYFQTDGVRVLFVLPQSWTDTFIPIAMNPTPAELVRVMVGRLELLTPEREQQTEAAVRDLGSPDPAARERAFAFLRDQGRYVEPIVRRVVASTGDDAVRTLCKRLLSAGFVTELRTAVTSAADGKRLIEDPVHVRAQLASLLRELGQDAEARAEATNVLTALHARQAPAMTDHNARHYLRASARAQEGLGDTAGEATAYETFVRFGSQVGTRNECRGCHADDGPRDMTWFRDWWAGSKYASAVARLGRLDSAIAGHEQTLANHPDDMAARMLLAYLYDQKGRSDRAASLWSSADSRFQLSLNAERNR